MIANIDIADKSYGDKILYSGLEFKLNAHEKVGLIGRNGTGKTTLFNILTGADTDFAGEFTFRKNLVTIDSRQEHHGFEDTPILEYILDDLPDYAKLKHILDTYPATMGSSMKKMEEYSEALERFNVLGYFSVEEEIERSLQAYQIDAEKIKGKIGQLSGGQKRFIELVKVQHARADLALIDEPTNHMDFVAKERFLDWFKSTKDAVVVITHDRDVLHHVDRIVEIRDGRAFNFKGNYDDYLRNNATKITAQVNEFTINQRRISNLKEDIVRFRRMKERARDPGTIHRFKSLEERAKKEQSDLEKMDKPSFWIDRESVDNLNIKMSKAYEEHKAKNIVIRTRTKATKSSNLLVEVSKLSLGYGDPLFSDINFQLREGEKLRLHGRNGAGKTTLIKAILATAAGVKPEPTIYGGVIDTLRELKIGVYEQEISSQYLDMPLARAIEHSFMAKDVKVGDEKVKQLLGDYLFNPMTDGEVPISRLSGGQKARFQLMNMLANDPALLILDEPTNHLDLPSIEELEDALKQYHGAIIYVSHDSYFVKNIGGQTLQIGN
jgi:ATP-binding cassette, subfamily F, member 3